LQCPVPECPVPECPVPETTWKAALCPGRNIPGPEVQPTTQPPRRSNTDSFIQGGSPQGRWRTAIAVLDDSAEPEAVISRGPAGVVAAHCVAGEGRRDIPVAISARPNLPRRVFVGRLSPDRGGTRWRAAPLRFRIPRALDRNGVIDVPPLDRSRLIA
jgi:hypothetical protein